MSIYGGIVLIIFGVLVSTTSSYFGVSLNDKIIVIFCDYLMDVDFSAYFPNFVEKLFILISTLDFVGIAEFLDASDRNKIAFYFLKAFILKYPAAFDPQYVEFFLNEQNSPAAHSFFKFIGNICFNRFAEHMPNYTDILQIINRIERIISSPVVIQPPAQTPNPTPSTFPWGGLEKFNRVAGYLGYGIGVLGVGLLGYGLYTGYQIATLLSN